MKKVFLLAAFGVAGMMSASSTSPEQLDYSISDLKFSILEKVKESKLILDEEWCGTVTYQTSCGFPIQDSYCTSWGTNCLDQAADAFDEFFCSP